MAIRPLINEKELLLQVAAGNQHAFSELFRAYNDPLAQYIFTLLESTQMCEEIVQDVFVKIWENREALPKLDKFTSYLFILTRNYTINCIRKMVKDKKHGALYIEDVLQQDQHQDLFSYDGQYQDLLTRAVAQLPPSQQRVIELRQQGLKTREIAVQMGISTDSVKKYQQWASSSVSRFLKAHTTIIAAILLLK